MDTRMKRKIDPEDNASNIPNPNHGTNGTNRQYDQNQGNRGKQLNPNHQDLASQESLEPDRFDRLLVLYKKHVDHSAVIPSGATANGPALAEEDLDQGDVFWYSGCGD